MTDSLSLPALRAIPGLVHGFGRRAPGELRETREETRARVAAALASAGRLLLLKQVHGATVVHAPWTGTPEADAALARAPGLLLGIETADCLPVLIVDPERRSVAAVHAGWRGSAAGVLTRAVEALVATGSQARSLVAALGPSIGPCCYEVGDDVAQAFAADAALVLRPGARGRPHLDLARVNALQLARAGLEEASVHRVGACTRCGAAEYHSYRREGRGCGRMISFVGFR